MKFKMKWAAAAAAALLTCGVSAQADNYDLTYQAIETQMLIGMCLSLAVSSMAR